jgi:hypothetical protein
MMASMAGSMAKTQGATPPPWLGRSRWSLLKDVIGGWVHLRDRVVQVVGLLLAFVRPGVVRARLERLRALGHVDVVPNLSQLLVAARDQMMLSASEETRIFYRAQGIPWIFHNLRRFISNPATMMDPAGLFSPQETIIHHVLQTFHRHAVYDLVLLRGFPDGLDEMERQMDQLTAGTHPHQRALTSLIEDGAYHARLPGDIRAFRANPLAPPRPIPDGLLSDPELMLGVDQFKDLRGYTNYASRLRTNGWQALAAWLKVGFDETIGGLVGVRLGPRGIRHECCDPEIAARHLPGFRAA